MTEAMSPLSMTFFAVLFKMMVDTPMYYAGGRIYVDSSNELKSPIMRKSFVKGLAAVDVLMQNAYYNVLKREDIMNNLYKSKKPMVSIKLAFRWLVKTIECYRKNDPTIAEFYMSRSRTIMKDLEQQAQEISGKELFDFIEKSMTKIKDNMMDTYGVVFAGAYASRWINKNLGKWLKEKNPADMLAQSVSNNVTSDMGLELLDVSDVVRKYPEVIKYLESPNDERFFEDLVELPGGIEVKDVMKNFLKKYGMRCSAEIDISKTRWNEKPTILVPLILGNIKVYPPNSHEIKFKQGLKEAKDKEQEILRKLEKMPGGRGKAKKAKKAISVLRNYAGYREFNKYVLVWYEWVVKQVIMKEAERLIQQGLIKEASDIFYLEYEELKEVLKTNELDYSIIQKRQEDYEVYQKLTPPTSII